MKTWLCGLVCLLQLAPLHAELVTGKDEASTLPFWEWRNDYMSMRLVQRLPDQTRAYFAGRGFGAKEVEYIAKFCIFQTVYSNISTAKSPRAIKHNISDWRYHYKGKTYPVKPRESWKPTWQKRKVPQAQIVAYEWSLLPSKQLFEAGDYNWGMTVFEVTHGDSFDLELRWLVDGKPQSATMKGVTCAKDVYVAPEEPPQ